jgi:hypothetical protein
MPSVILSDNGVSSGTSGIKTTGSNDGALALQTTTAGGTATTAISIDTSQSVSFVNNITVNGLVIGRGAGSVSTNVALGPNALAANTTGANNTAVGASALDINTTGANNTAVGYDALGANTTSSRHTAVGVQAGYSVATNDAVTAVGYFAGYSNTGGFATFFGRNAGYLSTAAKGTMIGDGAGSEITTGASNTILGRYTGNQDGLDIRTGSNYIVLSDGDGNIGFSTVKAGGTQYSWALPGAAHYQGTGITFPATQSASSNANTLDDYEEGSWTPTIFGSTTAGTTNHVSQQGWYVKIGNTVIVGFYVDYNAATGTGNLLIGGLPFASGGGSNYSAGSIMTEALNWDSGTMATLYKPPGTTNFSIYLSGDNLSWTTQTMDAAAALLGGCAYQV